MLAAVLTVYYVTITGVARQFRLWRTEDIISETGHGGAELFLNKNRKIMLTENA